MYQEEKGSSPKSMADILKEFGNAPVEKKPPHELSAAVDEIQKVLGFKTDDKYGYKYWLRKVKGYSYNYIMGVLKEVSNAHPKYNKGGMLTNKLSKKKKDEKKSK